MILCLIKRLPKLFYRATGKEHLVKAAEQMSIEDKIAFIGESVEPLLVADFETRRFQAKARSGQNLGAQRQR